jgi:hypothetical protein
LARKHGTKIAFLFLPYYNGPAKLEETHLYDRYGPTLNAAFMAPHAEWFADYGHSTRPRERGF